jgi:hypothetical protein
VRHVQSPPHQNRYSRNLLDSCPCPSR